MPVKRCSKCRASKPVDQFCKKSAAKDGLNSCCKQCKSIGDSAYYQANSETVKARVREAYWADPELSRETNRRYAVGRRAQVRARAKQWVVDNPERARAYRRQYLDDHPDENIEWREAHPDYHSNWKRENRDKVLSYSANRRARKRENWVEDVDRTVVLERDQGLCGLCHLAVNPDVWDLEHVVPFTRGGMHSYANTRVSHPSCNNWKAERLDSELPPMPSWVLARAQADAALAAAA